MFNHWKFSRPPEKILVIRLNAIGDIMATFPYIQYLRNTMPQGTVIDFLTRRYIHDFPASLNLFNNVYSFRGSHKSRSKIFWLLTLLPRLLLNNYDVVLDLQNNTLSNITRKAINPECWTEFDKFSSKHATKRIENTINNAGFIEVHADYNYTFVNSTSWSALLKENGWDSKSQLVFINPAGFFITRNWPLDNYLKFCNLFLQECKKSIQFIILGDRRVKKKAHYLKDELKSHLIDLSCKTTMPEAFSIIQHLYLTITEDGALMHASYLSGIPTVAILGSIREDWGDPKLPHTYCFSSSHLACGNCMSSDCETGTFKCLRTVTPEMVNRAATRLLL